MPMDMNNIVCQLMLALWQNGNLPGVYAASCPEYAGIGSSDPARLSRYENVGVKVFGGSELMLLSHQFLL